MRITIEPTIETEAGLSADCIHCKVIIEHQYDDLAMDDFMNLVKSAAMAFGYAEQTIDRYFGEPIAGSGETSGTEISAIKPKSHKREQTL